MKHRLILAACAALVFTVASCDQLGNKAPTPAETNAAFEAFVQAAARKSAAELTPDEVKEAVNQYIGMQAAATEAGKKGIDKELDVKAALQMGRANVLSDALLRQYLKANPISDADIQAEYDTQVKALPPEFKARHILVNDKALAEAIIQKLQAGGDFAALAKEYSKDGSAANGGDLGWFNAQTMVAPFAEAVGKLEKGKYSAAPVQTQFGWHVILLEDTRTPSLPPFDQVKDRVQQLVQRKKVAAHLLELRTTSGIDVEKLTAALTTYATTPKAPAKDETKDTAPAAATPPPASTSTPAAN